MTVVAALAILVGIVEMCGGVVLIVLSGSAHGYSTAGVVAFGIVTVLVGAIYAWVGSGLLKLDTTAWTVGLVISGFRAIYDLVWLLVQGVDGIGVASLIALIVNLTVFVVLWSSRARFGAGGGPGPLQPA